MEKKIFLLLFALALTVAVTGQTRKERKAMYSSDYNYEIETLGVGQDGTKLFKIWAYAKKPHDAVYKAKRYAVSAAIFKGIPAGNGAAPTPPIVSDLDSYDKHKDFYDEFFKAGGMYLNFVNSTTDGIPGGKDRIKMKKGYKVGLSVSLNYSGLRSYLEEKGIAKRLDAGF